MRLLVTGGSGYVGSVVAAELLGAGHQVVVYDRRVWPRIPAVLSPVLMVQGDLADATSLDALFRSHAFDAVLHFAASIEAGESMQHPERYFRNNTAGTLTLLEAMLAHDVRRLVFSSTAAVYGEPEHIPIAERHPLRPLNAYGESKLLVERMLEWMHRIHGLRYASLRYFNVAGAAGELGEDHRPETHLIPLVLQVALGKRPHVRIFGTDYPTPDGTCIRDYIHVLDLAAAHRLALQALEHESQLIYNLGNGQGFSIRNVIEAARRVTGHAIPAVEAARRPGDPAVLVAGSDKIRKELGWKPRWAELEVMVSSAWEWHRAHPHGYEES